MQLPTKTFLLAVLAGTSSAGRLIQREDIGTAAIIGTFTDSNCQTGQSDYSETVKDNWGTCRNLPGSSMKVWWLAKGCTGKSVLACLILFPNRDDPLRPLSAHELTYLQFLLLRVDSARPNLITMSMIGTHVSIRAMTWLGGYTAIRGGSTVQSTTQRTIVYYSSDPWKGYLGWRRAKLCIENIVDVQMHSSSNRDFVFLISILVWDLRIVGTGSVTLLITVETV
jgi:hypothetical protein